MSSKGFAWMDESEWEAYQRAEAARQRAEQQAWILTAREAIRRGEEEVTTGLVTRFVFVRPYTSQMFAEVPQETSFAVGRRAAGLCEGCHQPDLDRNLHHVRYDFCGYELPTDLLLLCRDCHTAQHQDPGGNFWVHVFDRVLWLLGDMFHYPEWEQYAERWLREQRVRHEVRTARGKALWRERCEALWKIERLVTQETNTPLPLSPLFTPSGKKFALLSHHTREESSI